MKCSGCVTIKGHDLRENMEGVSNHRHDDAISALVTLLVSQSSCEKAVLEPFCTLVDESHKPDP